MTAPARVAEHSVLLRHRNGGTTRHEHLTLDEARDLASRAVNQRKAQAAEIHDATGAVVGYTEAAA